MPNEATERKARRKATTEVGRAIMQRERQRMAREQAALGEAMVKESQMRAQHAEVAPLALDPEHNAISRGIVRRIAGVLASEQVNVPIFVKKGAENQAVDAWTDFKQISVTYRPMEDKRVLAATLRGLFYHEAGHIRFTLPPRTLWAMVKDKGVKPETFHGTAEFKLDDVFKAWNCLEDQRMETAVVSDSPRKAAYLTPLIMTEHLRSVGSMAANYPLLIWRRYLPIKLRAAARRMFIAQHNIKGLDGEALALRAEIIVGQYVTAMDIDSMWQAVCDFHDLLQEINPVQIREFGHAGQKRSAKDIRDLDDYLVIPIDQDMMDEDITTPEPEAEEAPMPEPPADYEVDTTDPEVAEHLTAVLIAMFWHPETLVPVIYANTSGAPEEQQGGASSSGSKDEDEEAEDEDSAKSAGDGPGNHGGGDDTEDDEDFDQDDLDDMLQEAEDERDNLSELDADMEAFADAREQTSGLPVYVGGLSGDIPAITKSVALADEIERSFKMHTMDRAPAWVEGQRRGVINVLRYETRRPGEVEFFKQWTDDDQPGHDMAVSLLLDYSGSMDDYVVQLAQAAYASKLACQRLGIPCTVTLWDTAAATLWDATEQAQGMPIIKEAGGTDPTVALLDLDNQRYERAKHIVIIMTDGDWSGSWAKRSLAAYKEPGRNIFGFGLGGTHLAKNLIARGCDAAYGINDLMEIPQRLEQFLLDVA